jgi:hypothetical protein
VLKVPAEQLVHVAMEAAPKALEKVPAMHATHALELDAPTVDE